MIEIIQKAEIRNAYKRYENARKKKGVTNYKVAKEIGIPFSTLYDWGYGKHIPKANTLLKISKYLGVSIEDILEGDTV